MAMPASDFELALKGLRLAPPPQRLEDAIGRMLASAGEESAKGESISSELTRCKPVVPSPELEEALEAELPVDVETESLLHSLQPAPICAEMEEELEVELAEDLAFEAWLSDARPSAQNGVCERAVAAQIGFHSVEAIQPDVRLAEVPALSEEDVQVVRPVSRWTNGWLVAAGLAATIVISVQAGFWGSGFRAPKATDPGAQSIAEAAEMFKNRSATAPKTGERAADTLSELSRFAGGATADGGIGSSLSSTSPVQGGSSDTLIPWSGAIPLNVQEALAAMTQDGTGTGLRIIGGPGDLGARLGRKQGDVDTSGGGFGGRFMAVASPLGDTKLPTTSGTTADTGKKSSTTGPIVSDLDPVPSLVKAIADGELAKVLPPDVLDRLPELPKIVANGPSSSGGPVVSNFPDIKVSSNGGAGLVGEATVSGSGLGTSGIPAYEGGVPPKGDPTGQTVVQDRSGNLGVTTLPGNQEGLVTTINPSAGPEINFIKVDDNVILELRGKEGETIAKIMTLSGDVLGTGAITCTEDLIKMGQTALLNIKTAVVPKNGD